MVIACSLRQLMRTPVKTVFFLVLLVCTVTFFMLGINLWSIASHDIDEINHVFVTIGTVQQTPSSLATGEQWNAYTKSHNYSSFPTYGSPIPLSVLDFKGANYIQKPEKRPIYYAYDPSYVSSSQKNYELVFDSQYLIVEMQPEQDCVPDEPVLINIKKILLGNPGGLVDKIWFCDSGTEHPQPLYAGKTYIISLSEDFEYNVVSGKIDKIVYGPLAGIEATQYKKDGERIRDTETITTPWDEVTDNFYETPRGERWLELIDAIERDKHIIPVVPTNSTKLLMSFFSGDSMIMEGRDISAEEYRSGEKVCLISQDFAQYNRLSVGDSMPLPLYNANYYSSPSIAALPNGLLNAQGKEYSEFEGGPYKIVGIYNTPKSGTQTNFSLWETTVVIPFASVKNSDENNIIMAGPMMGYSTSFQIPNGQIDKFMAAWNAQGISGLDIEFYDSGYTKIKAGLDAMANTAVILFGTGAVTTLFVVILFCHLFITKQRKRTAIERSLGMSKKRCALSLLAGMMVVVTVACASGCVAGYSLTGWAMERVNAASSQGSFNTAYSDWVNSADAKTAFTVALSEQSNAAGVLACAAIIPVTLLIAAASIRGNLKSEPLRLLGERER